jgi:recombination protein RecA
MGLQARLMSQAMRKLTAIIGKSRTILIFINQIRMKIGVMFGNPETTTGGNALKFYSSVRLEVRKTETIDGGKDEDAVGNRVRVKVVKNKVAPPFRRAELDVIFGKGVSAIGSLLDAAVKYEIIDKKGAWYSYGEEKVGQGREGAKEYLEQNPAFAQEVESKLRKIIFPGREFAVPVAKPVAPAAAVEAAAASVAPAVSEVPDVVSLGVSNGFMNAALGHEESRPASQPEVPEAAVVSAAMSAPAVAVAASAVSPDYAGAPDRRGPGRPPANPAARAAEAPVVHRGPGRPPANPAPRAPAVSEAPAHRGPGRPRKAAPGEGDGDALF